jgi:hypothetical protein
MRLPAGGAAAPSEPGLDLLLHTGPFHAALRSAIRERGLTLQRLQARLASRGIPLALSSLSDWQHGHRRPGSAGSLRAVRALEEILGLPAEALMRLLVAPSPVPGRVMALRPRQGLDENTGDLARLLDGLPGSRERSLEVVFAEEKAVIDADRRTASVWRRLLVRCIRSGAERYILRYFGDPGCRIDRVRVRGTENCRLGQMLRNPSGILVAEILFGETLSCGDTWVFEYRVDDGTGQPATELAHGFRMGEEQLVMEVRFQPTALPVDCHTFAQAGLYDPRHRTADLRLNQHHAVHLVVQGMDTGVLGIAWSWPDRDGDRARC